MDVSTLFKASVKTVTLRNKAVSEIVDSPAAKVPPKTRPKSNQETEFLSKVHSVTQQISSLRELLLEKRSAYLNLSQHLVSGSGRMTDSERDVIDTGAQKIITTCSQLIKDLKGEIRTHRNLSRQNLEHREVALNLTEAYLKNVCKIYSEQRAIRIKRSLETRKMARLKNLEDKSAKVDLNESNSLKIQEINGDVGGLTYEEELSPEDVQMLESENEQLFNELNSLTEDVRQIESKVVHIAELQEMFTHKVLDQDKNLDVVMNTVVNSTENVREANEQIRQAIQRNAGLRVWILFFLLVMSFTLLFLNWYNP